MLFSSPLFIFIFLPISLLIYFIAPRKLKNLSLLAVSLLFYGFGEPIYILVMLTSITWVFVFGIAIEKSGRYRKILLTSAVAGNLLCLGFFKYFPPISGFFGYGLSIALPVGISFYTFQALSYVVDVYRGERAQKSIVNFGLYITMFPQLIAGPIVKYTDIKDSLNSRRVSTWDIQMGISRFVTGLGKKLILANGAGEMWEYFQALPKTQLTTLGAWLGIIFFAFQIYFDFSGYSDMAIGLGLFFGFHFPENFNYPYTSTSVRDFWKRWHITLTDWFGEYVYIPLGGNRRGKARTYLNMLIVWGLTGIWHGAGISFILWGFYYFLILSAEKLFLNRLFNKLPTFISRFYTAIAVLIGWVFFALPSTGGIRDYLYSMFTLRVPMGIELYHFVRNIPFLIILFLGATKFPRLAYRRLISLNKKMDLAFFTGSLALFFLCIANLMGESYNPFLYFRF